MRFRVFPLRVKGRRLPWREVQNGPSYTGDLVTYYMEVRGERYAVATLMSPEPAQGNLLPDLYEPVLLGFAPLAFRLRGFERLKGAQGPMSVVQEWHVEMP